MMVKFLLNDTTGTFDELKTELKTINYESDMQTIVPCRSISQIDMWNL